MIHREGKELQNEFLTQLCLSLLKVTIAAHAKTGSLTWFNCPHEYQWFLYDFKVSTRLKQKIKKVNMLHVRSVNSCVLMTYNDTYAGLLISLAGQGVSF
jgi:hypothetical protein